MKDSQLIHEKISQAAAVLEELNIDVWLTFVRESMLAADPVLELIAGVDVTWQSAFFVCRDGRHVTIIGHFDAANLEGSAYEVIPYHEGLSEPLRQVLAEKDPQTIAINYSQSDVAADGLSHGMYLNLLKILEGTPFVDRLVSAERVISAVRGRKSETEVERVRAAVKITEQLFDEVEQFVKPGMTQRDIANFVHQRIDEMGLDYAWPKPFNPIVTCGPHSPIGHAEPGAVVLERGHLLHLDLGVKLNDYCSDLQRMWYVLDEGESEAPPDVLRAFEVVKGAIITGGKHVTLGTPGWKVDEVAREYIADNGFPEYMHAFGHLLGRIAHDGAAVLGPKWERYGETVELPVEVGNIFTLELHVVVENRGIMSLEEDVLVTESGIEYLSRPQTELRYLR